MLTSATGLEVCVRASSGSQIMFSIIYPSLAFDEPPQYVKFDVGLMVRQKDTSLIEKKCIRRKVYYGGAIFVFENSF